MQGKPAVVPTSARRTTIGAGSADQHLAIQPSAPSSPTADGYRQPDRYIPHNRYNPHRDHGFNIYQIGELYRFDYMHSLHRD